MTHRKDAASDVLGRWRMLAEQRLEHLTELFESGRWRRYYGEMTFLENIREAKAAVETWRDLSATRLAAAEPFMRMSWPAPPRAQRLRATEPPPAVASAALKAPAAMKAVAADEPLAEPMIDMLALERVLDTEQPVLDFAAIEQRYPLLRNVL